MPVAGKINREEGLRHQLSAGQMAMVAVGGSIGTGLLLGSAAALSIAGPGVIISFALAAFINWTVAMALGELSSMHPAAGSFGLYGDLYLNQWAGFIARAGYWAAIAVSIGAELVASATYMAYWFPSVPALFWVVGFSIVLLLVNLRSVGNYGRFEYWFAMIKVVTIAVFITIGAALLLNGHVPPQYTAQGGFLPKGPLAPLLAMGFALYTFAGIEFVAITTGETRSVKEIPRAIRLTFAILTLVYLGAIIVLVGVMPWNRAGVTESPFVTVFRHAGIPAAPHIMTFVVLTAAHVKFRQRLSADQLAALPMRSPLGAWGSALGFVLIILAFLETGWRSHLTLISGAVYMVVLTAAYFLLKKAHQKRTISP